MHTHKRMLMHAHKHTGTHAWVSTCTHAHTFWEKCAEEGKSASIHNHFYHLSPLDALRDTNNSLSIFPLQVRCHSGTLMDDCMSITCWSCFIKKKGEKRKTTTTTKRWRSESAKIVAFKNECLGDCACRLCWTQSTSCRSRRSGCGGRWRCTSGWSMKPRGGRMY